MDATSDAQRVDGVEIRVWRDPFPAVEAADVVVEAFGCGVPEGYAAAMARAPQAPVWFVLEYLSAEPWIDGAHALPSPHPRLPLARRFWFPGFTAESGGLLRERGLIAAREAFRRNDAARTRFWSSLALAVPAPGERRVSLFCYPNPALPALLDAWADGDDPITCLVPEGIAAGALDRWTSGNVPHAGHPFARGRLTLHAIPFLAQDDYDRLLWSCEANLVRGEDSFVRAQWAARPFAWHIYPQDGGTHLRKLAAFLDRYGAGLEAPAALALRRFHQAWNGDAAGGDIGAAWLEFAKARPQLETHAERWSAQLALRSDLAAGLVSAAADRV